MIENISIYTDGSSRGNPGKGGYGIVMKYKQHHKEMSAAYRKTTNNRMELLAVIVAIRAVHRKELPIQVYSDSKYVVDAINQKWIDNWQLKRFSKVKNPDLWKELIPLLSEYKVTFNWVKGHADNPYNNRCDELATIAADNGPYLVDKYYEEVEVSGSNELLDI